MITRPEPRGIEFRSLTGAIDTATPGGELVFHIFAALAQMERRLLSERTRAGLAAAKHTFSAATAAATKDGTHSISALVSAATSQLVQPKLVPA